MRTARPPNVDRVPQSGSTGVDFYRYQDGFLHQKVMLIDDTVATTWKRRLENYGPIAKRLGEFAGAVPGNTPAAARAALTRPAPAVALWA